MKFNPDCVRDILLTAQDEIRPKISMEFETYSQYERLKTYSDEEIIFHIIECGNSGILTYHDDVIGTYYIDSITEKGRELLSKIENESSWKKIASKGIFSIPSLISTVEAVVNVVDTVKNML